MTVDLRFSRSEYDSRLAKTRLDMERRGLDLLIVTDPSNMNWLTGYDGWSFYVHQCVVVAPTRVVWFGRGQDAAGALRTVHMGGEDICGYPDHFVQSTERHPMDHLSAKLADWKLARGRIGVEMDNYWFTAAAFAALYAGLPDASFADATGLVNWLRSVKSPRELQYMREAGGIVTRMHGRVFEMAAPGVRKCDLAAAIQHESLRFDEEAGHGGDYAAIVPLLPSGSDTAAPHLTWDDSPLKEGEGAFFELAGCVHRYHCPLSRTLFLGEPPKSFLDIGVAVSEGMEAGLEAARPGNTCDDVARAFLSALERRGIVKDSRAGYPIGLSYPPDWGERTMSLRPGDMTVLEENMTFHFMTGVWMDDRGFEITESIRIADGPPECLAHVPRELMVK